MSKRKVIRAMHKIISNKTSKIKDIINCTLRQLIRIILSLVKCLFDKYIKKKMQSSYFKKTITIMLRKSRNKNYFKSLFFKLIALLNILNKILKLIILKRLRYVIKTHDILSNTQIRIRKQRLIDTMLQLIIKKIYTI